MSADCAAQDAELAWIGLGANLGDPLLALEQALTDIAALPGTELLAVSSLYRTAPIDAVGPDFLNAVARVSTRMHPDDLLAALLAIEQRFGRERPHRNAPRTLDLDLLLWGRQQLHHDGLTLPHPRMHLRAFVLAPLTEIDPDVYIPGLGPAIRWLAQCADQSIERLTTAPEHGHVALPIVPQH